jgi:hypothetical protein
MNYSPYNTKHLIEMFHVYFGWNRARIHCIVALILGIIQLGTVNLTKIACTFPGSAQPDSSYKRLQRLFRKFTLNFDKTSQFIAHLTGLERWKLTLDRTNWKFGIFNVNYLTLGIAHIKIAFPVLWTCLDKKGNSNTQERTDLLERFLKIFGASRIFCLLADREFIGQDWFKYLINKSIIFRIRIKNNTRVTNSRGVPVPVKNLFRHLPRRHYLILSSPRQIWGHSLYMIGFKMADGELVIITTQEQPETALEDYKERWQIETLFSCLKTRGFDLEATHMKDPERLEKLLAFTAIAFSWAHLIGEWRHEVKPIKIKKHERPARSLFRHGLDYLRNCLSHRHETKRQSAFHRTLELLFKPLGWNPYRLRFFDDLPFNSAY